MFPKQYYRPISSKYLSRFYVFYNIQSRDFPKKLFHMLSPGGHSTGAEHKQTGPVVERTGANTKIFAFNVVTLAGMYAMKILLDINRKAERLQRVYPFKFSKARDGGNRPRMFKTRIFNES